MEMLLAVIMAWITVNFDLPTIHEPPRVDYASPLKMAEVRYDRVAATGAKGAVEEAGRPAPVDTARNVHGMYDVVSRTIYLLEGWSSSSPADLSVLVHELVHHLQAVNGLDYACAEEREKLAYQAQALWLKQFGKSLALEFNLDAMTLLVRTTACTEATPKCVPLRLHCKTFQGGSSVGCHRSHLARCLRRPQDLGE